MITETKDFQINTVTYCNKYCGTNEEVVIPDGVTIIGKSAFERNESIKSVIIPNTVIGIDPDAFMGCLSLEKIVFSKNFANCNSKLQ